MELRSLVREIEIDGLRYWTSREGVRACECEEAEMGEGCAELEGFESHLAEIYFTMTGASGPD